MTADHTRVRTTFAIAVLALALALPALAQDGDVRPRTIRGAEASAPVVPFVFEGDLRDLPKARAWQPGDPIKEIPRRGRPPAYRPERPDGARDPLLDRQADVPASRTSRAFAVPDLSFDGMGFSGVNPPDTVGDVGPNHYIQMINGSSATFFTVHDKSTGAILAGPTALQNLGSGDCADGLGDPIVLYDRLADRWLLSEFSTRGDLLCVYISQTPDPISGGWYNYDFAATNFPDYPKYGVWPDGYYIGTNENSPALYALDRAAMLTGAPATFQRMTVGGLAGFGFEMVTPSDLDGAAPPPAGSPNFFMRHRDDESHNGSPDPSQDFLEIFEFSVDFANPANTTVTGPIAIPIAEIDSDLCGLVSFNCIAQPGTNTELDPLREVVMWRVQYRNFGSHETLVSNLATDVSGADQAGIRWFELRRSGGGPWSLFQEGTYAPDGDSRWMGSAAMDGSGNLAVGYNVSSGTTFPGLRYAGRLAGDPAGTLPQGEATLVAGTASNASNRYGDYSSLNVDPADDCTFWLTGEYNVASQWSTRIGRFRFDSCSQLCGNGTIDPGESCDGADLGGQTCADFGCTGGGTLACNAFCDGFDTSGCFGCPAICGDGTCDAGEDCDSCPADCPELTAPGASCGNGVCEAGNGEDCLSCAADCNGKQNGKPANRFCCGDGDGQNPVGCGDSRCTTGGFGCTSVPVDPTVSCCGDLVCEGLESSLNCPIDCGSCTVTETPEATCNDGIDNDCDGDVDCDDTDCAGTAACGGGCTLGQPGDSCTANSQCCSNKCKGQPGNQTCR